MKECFIWNKINKFIQLKNKNKYYFLFLNFFIIIIINFIIEKNHFIKYKEYVSKCKKLIKFKKNKSNNFKNPFISICLPVYNMEKYIERSILSIINQSFENFEIIIANDNSNDKTNSIIQKLKYEDNRIKILNHRKNLGVYSSRSESIFLSRGEYILLMDPDDMILNQNLFEELYNYNLKYHLDIIEFTVYYQNEGKNNIYLPIQHEYNHYHRFNNSIINQPELSKILFHKPNSNNYSEIICRTVWNKLYKRNILLKTINYIEKDFHNKFLVAADDTPINMIYFQFANNYSNIFLPGYLYYLRKNSVSNKIKEKEHLKIVCINYLFYFKLFYRYIIEFNKDLNYLYYDLSSFSVYLLEIKKLDLFKYIIKVKGFLYKIINNRYISKDFKNFINKLIFYFN